LTLVWSLFQTHSDSLVVVAELGNLLKGNMSFTDRFSVLEGINNLRVDLQSAKASAKFAIEEASAKFEKATAEASAKFEKATAEASAKFEKATAEKAAAEASAKFAIEKATAEKAESEQISSLKIENLNYKLKVSEADTLRSKGAVSARGIFEHYLKRCWIELHEHDTKQKRFDATMTCKLIDEYDPASTKQKSEKVESLKALIAQCPEFEKNNLAELYGILCHEIHGAPWSGPSIQYHSKGIPAKFGFVIKGIAEFTTLNVDDVST
jgi:hypothetical protein